MMLELPGKTPSQSRPSGSPLDGKSPPRHVDVRDDEDPTYSYQLVATAVVLDTFFIWQVVGEPDHFYHVKSPALLASDLHECASIHFVGGACEAAVLRSIIGTAQCLTIRIHEVEFEQGDFPLLSREVLDKQVGYVEHRTRRSAGNRHKTKQPLPVVVTIEQVVVHPIRRSHQSIGEIDRLWLRVLQQECTLIIALRDDIPKDCFPIVDRYERAGTRGTAADLRRHLVIGIPQRVAPAEQSLLGHARLRSLDHESPIEDDHDEQRRHVVTKPHPKRASLRRRGEPSFERVMQQYRVLSLDTAEAIRLPIVTQVPMPWSIASIDATARHERCHLRIYSGFYVEFYGLDTDRPRFCQRGRLVTAIHSLLLPSSPRRGYPGFKKFSGIYI